MNPNLILSDHRFLHTTPGFRAAILLERLQSPRLQDMKMLAAWIDFAADEAGISRELLCCVAQKEQSALTALTLSGWQKEAFCGYGVTYRGQDPQSPGPQPQLIAAAKCLRYWSDRWTPRFPEPCPDGDVVAANAATYALYRYTPSRADKANLLSIWQFFDFGDPLAEDNLPSPERRGAGGEAKPMRPCSDDVAAIARAAAEGHASGGKTYTKNGIVFDLVTGGWCGQFVRQCYAAAARNVDPVFSAYGFPWLRRYASEACQALEEGGYRTREPQPGDIVGMSPGYRRPGHIGIYLGGDPPQIAENTSSTSRGPGTVISPLSAVADRLTGYYRVFPARDVIMPDDLAVVLDGQIIACHPTETAGVTRADVRPLLEALGFEPFYRVMDDGRKRIYLKPIEGGASPP